MGSKLEKIKKATMNENDEINLIELIEKNKAKAEKEIYKIKQEIYGIDFEDNLFEENKEQEQKKEKEKEKEKKENKENKENKKNKRKEETTKNIDGKKTKDKEEINESIYLSNKDTDKKKEQLEKEIELLKKINIEVPKEVKINAKKAFVFQLIKSVIVFIIYISVIYLYLKNNILNIWYIRGVEIICLISIIFLSEKMYSRYGSPENKGKAINIAELVFFSISLLLTTEVIINNKEASSYIIYLLIVAILIYYLLRAFVEKKIVYRKYIASRSDVREILKK